MNTQPNSPSAQEDHAFSRSFFRTAGKKGWDKVKSKRSPEYFREIGKKGLAKRYANKPKEGEEDKPQS